MVIMESSFLYNALVFGAHEVMLHKDDLNHINVFPVADGDTGTNLNATMQALLQYIKKDDNLCVLFQTAAHGAFVGARGNSGLIFAQFIDFCSQEMPAKTFVTISEFAEMIGQAVKRLYQSIVNPTEGTILSVMRTWSLSLSNHIKHCTTLEDCINRTVEDCRHALLDTPNQLPILKRYGVVDSGAKGFYCFLLGFQKSFCNTLGNKAADLPVAQTLHALPLLEEAHDTTTCRYCCEVILTGNSLDHTCIKKQLVPHGDSILVAGNTKQIKVHVHTNSPPDIFAILEEFGKLWDPKVEDMLLQQAVRKKKKSSIAIVTDSIADLPPGFALDNQVFIIPFLVDIDGTCFLDRLTLTEEQFTALNKTTRQHPQTSLPSRLQIQRLFEFLTSHYNDILVLSVSSRLSGAYNMLRQFANEWLTKHNGTNIAVVDTRKNSGAQGLIVMEASRLAQRGDDMMSIVSQIESLRDHIHILVAMHTTRYLARSGRVSQSAGRLTQFLHLRPIMGLDPTGSGITFGVALFQKSLVRKIIKIIKKEQRNFDIQDFCVVHSQNQCGAQQFSQAIEQIIGYPPRYIATISPIVQSIAGEKAIAVSYIRRRKDSP